MQEREQEPLFLSSINIIHWGPSQVNAASTIILFLKVDLNQPPTTLKDKFQEMVYPLD
jgi:hypothetical protein